MRSGRAFALVDHFEVTTSLFLSRHHFTSSAVFNCGHDVATSLLMSRHQLPALVLLNRRPWMS